MDLLKQSKNTDFAPYRAELRIGNKIHFLGKFATELEAERAERRALYVLGFHDENKTSVSAYNIGNSDYSEHVIQPWQIWADYGLNGWDSDIIKRILRKKAGDSRRMDYEKIKHICDERIRQIDEGFDEFLK